MSFFLVDDGGETEADQILFRAKNPNWKLPVSHAVFPDGR
jgi:hypothetical protein